MAFPCYCKLVLVLDGGNLNVFPVSIAVSLFRLKTRVRVLLLLFISSFFFLNSIYISLYRRRNITPGNQLTLMMTSAQVVQKLVSNSPSLGYTHADDIL